MPKTTPTHDHFNFSYRADCIDCKRYVGPKRASKPEAENDTNKHKNITGNEDHDVKIEVTQSFHV